MYVCMHTLVFVALMCLAPNPAIPRNRQLPMLQTATSTTLSIVWNDNPLTQSFCESQNIGSEYFSLAPYVFSIRPDVFRVDGMIQVSESSVKIFYTVLCVCV